MDKIEIRKMVLAASSRIKEREFEDAILKAVNDYVGFMASGGSFAEIKARKIDDLLDQIAEIICERE